MSVYTTNDLRYSKFRVTNLDQGDRVDRPVGACFPEAASHLPELEGPNQVHPTRQGWPTMV